jgi:hypothetical protein
MRSEANAVKLICPLMSRGGNFHHCQGSDCMAWEWDGDGYERRHMPRTPKNFNEPEAMHEKRQAEALQKYLDAGWEVYEGQRPTDLGPEPFTGLRRKLPARVGDCNALVPRAMPVYEG